MVNKNEIFYNIVLNNLKDVGNDKNYSIDDKETLKIQAAKGKGSKFYEGLMEIKKDIGATNTLQWVIFSDQVILQKD